MPANGTVDERIVEMRIDHQKFESGAKKTISILESLDRGLKSLGKNNTDGFDGIASSLDKVTNKISVFGTIGDQVIRTLTNKAMDLVAQMGKLANTLTIDQIAAGWDKYAEKTQGVQTIMAATAKDWEDQGAQMEWVNGQLEKLNWFTDETSYSFLDMVNNIGKFTSSGVELETAVTAMQGISTWAAISGANVQQASHAMYNLSQALSTGSVKLMDWKSIENATMSTVEFKETALETAVALGTLEKAGDGVYKIIGKETEDAFFTATEKFNSSLSEGWFTSDVLLETLNKYGAFATALNDETTKLDMTATEFLSAMEAYKEGIKKGDMEEFTRIAKRANVSVEELTKSVSKLSTEEYDLGYRAFLAAQEAKTFKEAIDATKDAVSTGWMNIWEMIFGDYLEAKELWTDLAETLYNVFADPVNKLSDVIERALNFNGIEESAEAAVDPTSELGEYLLQAGLDATRFVHTLNEINPDLGQEIADKYGSIDAAFKAGAIDAETFRKVLEKLAEYGTGRQAEELGPNGKKKDKGWMATPEEEARAAERLEAYNYLLENGTELLDRWTEKVTEASNVGEEKVPGGQLFREGLMELMDTINNFVVAFNEAMDLVFGGTDSEGNIIPWTDVAGDKLYDLIVRFREFVDRIKISDEDIESLSERLSGTINTFRTIGSIFGTVFSIIGSAISLIWGAIKESGILGSIFRGLLSVPERLASGLSKIGTFIENAANKFKEFMQSEQVVNALVNGILALQGAFGKISVFLQPVFAKITRFFQIIGKLVTIGFNQNGLLGVFRNLHVYLRLLLRDHPVLFKFFQLLETAFGSIGKLASSGAKAIGDWFSNIDFTKFSSFFEDFKNLGFLETATKLLGNFFDSAKNFFSGLKIDTSGITDTFEKVKAVFSLIFDGLFGDPTEFKERIKMAILNVLTALKEALEGITISDVLTGMRLAGLATLVAEITGIFATFRDLEKQVVGIPEAISKMFGNLGDAFKNLSLSFKTNALVKVLIGVGILAASLVALSKIPQDDLTHTAVVVGLLFLVIAKIATGIGNAKVGNNVDIKKFQVFSDFAGALIGLAVLILAVSSALKTFLAAKDAGYDVAGALLGIGFLILAIAGVLAIASKMPKEANALAMIGTILAIAFAIRMLVSPITKIAAITDPDALKTAGNTIFQLLVTLALVTFGLSFLDNSKLGTSSKGLMKAAGAMVVIAIAIGLLLIPLMALTKSALVGPEMAKAAGVIAVLGMGLTVFAAMLSKLRAGPMLGGAAAMVIIAIAIGIVVPAILAITGAIIGFATTIPWESLSERMAAFKDAMSALGSLALVMLGFGAAIFFIGAGVALFGAGIVGAGIGAIVFAGALFLVSLALGKLGEVFPMFIDGIASAGETIKEHWREILLGTGAFLAMALAVGLLMRSVGKLINGERFGRGFAAFTSSIATGIGTMITSIGSNLLDNLPKLLPILGAILIMAAAYFVGIIPDLTGICVDAFVTLFNSVADELEKNQDAIVESVSRIATASIGIAKQVAVKLLDAVLDEITTSWNEAFENGFHLDKFAIALVESILLLVVVGRAIVGVFNLVKAAGTITTAVSTAATASGGAIVSSLGSILFWVLLVIGAVAALRQGFIDLGNQFENAEKSRNEKLFDNADASIDERINKFSDLQNKLTELNNTIDEIAESGDLEKLMSPEYERMLAYRKQYEIQLINAKSDLARDLAEVTGESYQDIYKQLSEADDYTQTAIYQKYLEKISEQKEILNEELKPETIEDYVDAIAKTKSQIASLNSDLDNGKGGSAEQERLAELQTQLETLIAEYEALKQAQEQTNTETTAPTETAAIPVMPSFDIEAVKESVGSQVNTAFGELGDYIDPNLAGDPIIKSMTSGIQNGEGSITDTVLGILSSGVATGSDSAIPDANAAGYNIGAGVADGIYQSGPIVETASIWLASLTSSAFSGIKGIDSHSPSKVFARLGAFIPAGVAKGIEDNSDTAEDSITILASGVVAAMQQAMARVAMIADEDFDISPRITPVVDMSNLTSAAGNAGSLFDNIGTRMRGSMRVSMDTAQNTASAMKYGSGTDTIVNEIQRLSTRLEQLGDAVTGMQIVLDTGTLVGATSRKMDNAFGVMQARKGRGN